MDDPMTTKVKVRCSDPGCGWSDERNPTDSTAALCPLCHHSTIFELRTDRTLISGEMDP